MFALINWPTFAGIAEKNPAEVMPLVTRDTLYEYFAFRNRYQDKDDVVTSVLINQPEGTKPRDVMVWGLSGLRLNFGGAQNGAKVTDFTAGKDGSATLKAGNFAMAVDYSKVSGADALIVTMGGEAPKPLAANPKIKTSTLTVGGATFNVLTLSASGQHPEVKAEGGALVAGGQTIRWDGQKFTLSVFTPAAK